jgi:hypothetical protein
VGDVLRDAWAIDAGYDSACSAVRSRHLGGLGGGLLEFEYSRHVDAKTKKLGTVEACHHA